MADRPPSPAATGRAAGPPSPLDPFLSAFLREVDALERGYSPIAHIAAMAAGLELEAPFVETLFISARARGLVAVSFERGSRNRWRVSPRGRRWLAEGSDAALPVAAPAVLDEGGAAGEGGPSALA